MVLLLNRLFRRVWFVALGLTTLAILLAISQNTTSADPDPADLRDRAAAEVIAALSTGDPVDMAMLPDLSMLGPPPWTSYVPGRSTMVVHAWSMLVDRGLLDAPVVSASRLVDDGEEPVSFAEAEPAEVVGDNDTFGTGQTLSGFGTAPGLARQAEVAGVLATSFGGSDCALNEDDGSIGASSTIDLAQDEFVVCNAFIGDGPFGSRGDYDFFEITTDAAGQRIIVDISATRSFVEPTFVIAVYAADGSLLRSLRDDGIDPEVYLDIALEQPGRYYAVVGGCCGTPTDPFVSGSGPNPSATGPYELTLAKVAPGSAWPSPVPPAPPTCVSVEDDGSIPLATRVAMNGATAENCVGEIGDGPHGRTTGDVDMFFVPELRSRQQVRLAVRDNADPFVAVDIVVYDVGGAVVQSAEGVGAREPVTFSTLTAGDHWIALSAAGGGLTDPFVSDSGRGVGWTGAYSLSIDIEPDDGAPTPNVDLDVYLVNLEVGDAMSVAVVGNGVQQGGFLEVVDPAQVGRMGASYSQATLYPTESPLAQFGTLSVDHVAARSGLHGIIIGGPQGDYEARLRISQAGIGTFGEKIKLGEQIIFVDFDGASTEPQRLSPFGPQGEVELSPLSASLNRFGLAAADESDVIDEVLATITRTLETELRGGPNGDRDQSGVDGDFDITILNSRDHASPWGDRNVSRVIIGGTQAELGIPTVGISESIDPGNFAREETAVVLLDLLSSQDSPATSINRLALDASLPKSQLVGSTIGLIAAHEIGHFLGNWHTDGANATASVMDSGGDLRNTVGAGADMVVGTGDDQRVSFVEDAFSRAEDFTGRQDTRARTAHGLATAGAGEPLPRQPFAPNVVPGIVEAEDFDIGEVSVAYNEVDGIANRGGAYRSGDVDIWPTLNQPGGHTVGTTRDGEWLEYTVEAQVARTFVATVRLASGAVNPGSLELSVDGELAAVIDVRNTGGWWRWTTPTLGNVDLTAGEHVVRLGWTDGANINVDWFALGERGPRVASAVPGRVQAEDYDIGGQNAAYNDVDMANRGGALRDDGVDLWPIVGEPGGVTVGTTRDGEWLEYTVEAANGGIYDFTLRVASGAADPGAIDISIDGRTVGRLAPEPLGWWNWAEQPAARAYLPSGKHIVRLTWADGAEINLDWFESAQCRTSDCWSAFDLFLVE